MFDKWMNRFVTLEKKSPVEPLKSSVRSGIDPFIVMDIMVEARELANTGKDVIHMEVGQPSTSAPKAALEAAQTALQNNTLGYTDAVGIPELRERIAQYYKETYNLEVSSGRIIVTTGSSAGFILAFLACFDEGAAVALPSPGYPCYRHIMTALGLQPVRLCTDGLKGRWMPDAIDIERAIGFTAKHKNVENLKGLILASPANPTGTMINEDQLKALLETCDKHKLWFISDEIYHGLTYERSAQTALMFSDDAIVINSFSKYFSMTGWRIGWMVVPEILVRPIERLAQNLFISVPAVSQYAALGSFDGIDELEANKARYAKNRLMLLDELSSAGLTDVCPADGAFYLYANIEKFSDNSADFTKRMLHDIGVAATPGLDFDELKGQYYTRFSYAGKFEDMVEAARRIKGWLK